ncbi:MAG: alpha/beta hydrolase [Acidobacteria bacterium]|nr:alpha/beta hydrolase [Acidobacteriota bacterium]
MERVVAPSRLLHAQIAGPVGPLEGLVRVPEPAVGAAVVAHPHPQHGGTMHTKVVHRTARFLADRFHLLTVRFNFRGVGASAGFYDDGRGETDDLVAAVQHARGLAPQGPLVLAGFSFGSLCALRAAERVRPAVLLLLGVPLERWTGEGAADLPPGLPVLWVQGEDDQFGSGAEARARNEALGFRLATVPHSDHFFSGRLDAYEEAAVALLRTVLPEGP